MRRLVALLVLPRPAMSRANHRTQAGPSRRRLGLDLSRRNRVPAEGHASAITGRRVLRVIEYSAYGSIAATSVEWAAYTAQVTPWMIIDSHETAKAFAEALVAPPRQAFGRNAINTTLLVARRLMETMITRDGGRSSTFGGQLEQLFRGRLSRLRATRSWPQASSSMRSPSRRPNDLASPTAARSGSSVGRAPCRGG